MLAPWQPGAALVTLAIFDLDNTLIAGDSDHLWGEFLVESGCVNARRYKALNDKFYDDYLAGTLDIVAYQEFVLAPLTRFSPAERADLHTRFMASKIEPIRLPKAEALIQQHRSQGHTLLIITATNRFITAPIATLLGIDNLIATEGEIIGDHYTGKLKGIASFGTGKVARLQHWLTASGETMHGSTFYSDSHNDIPLLEFAENAVAVDADDKLAAIARKRHWRQLSLR